MKQESKPGRYQWQIIFFCFVLAAATGVLYRLGMIIPLSGDLSLQNIRHAHSHLMFFGWAAALPLYIMVARFKSLVGGHGEGIGLMSNSVWGMLLFGLLSYPFFLFYGYHPVPFGESALPLSVILSGLVMVSWYVFIGGYLSVRKRLDKDERNVWFEAALVMLFVCSLGAWGVAVAQALNVTNPLVGKALTHFFLACFSEGWVVLVIVALLDDVLELSADDYPFTRATLAAIVVLSVPLTFPYGISETLLTPVMLGTARIGGVILGTVLCVIGYSILNSGKAEKSIFIWPLVLLLLKAVMQLIASVIPSGFWLSDFTLHILYLHVLLLGAFTLAGIGYLHRSKNLGRRSYSGIVISIVIVLVSLLLLTRLWPLAWGGMWVYYVVAGAAVLPVITVAAEWYKLKTI